ncbi:hypothetical protein G7067_05110 [Leucobacter insecticola]|uniref:Uncharacterized protein n=1 Tax=Leucobacter insecticola TaxID=2714934 RepID=A0A6G8FHV1_9MICO|nr:hypothetical protein [Leucobacter insecticola]QIM15937.1 hypothetical protein G7067_05110 [Leucobacter insecticola]
MNLWAVVAKFAEDEAAFDPTKVTPGWEGFAFTGLVAVAIIALGFNLVARLRRNAYRAEVREEIAAELSGGDDSGETQDPAQDSAPGAPRD